jgi:tape measure domain-containing protein
MRFDNKQFESNVATTMSTLEKLKQKLKLTESAKSLENLGAAAKKVDMSGITSGVETVHARFSALEVMGVTALANITNAAVNAGKRMVDALTLEPVRTGFQEYETQINATQTILANVEHKGKSIDDVNRALEELNKYADLTIYNFTEMTRNIGLFTNAGVGLDESVSAIKGFSNAAAMAGTDATRTAGAMYQLSQAMSSGAIRLMDWRSLEQANITGERFRETIMMTARAHGIAIDDMIKKEGNFRDTLSSGWLTADLMSEALEHYTLSTKTMTAAEQEAAREKMRSNGYTEEQIKKLFELGTAATSAATEVKTFTQLWGVMKESAQSGWSQTWKLIVGDFYEAKALLTPLSNFFTGVIGSMSDVRNKILDSALGRGVLDTFKNLGKVLDGVAAPVEKVTESLEDLEEMARSVWRGEWGNGDDRFNRLTEAGKNYYRVQNKVNELMGDGFRYTQEEIEAQDKLLGIKSKSTKKTDEQSGAVTKLTDAQKNQLKHLMTLTEAELKAKGYNDDQIASLKELGATADKLGIPLFKLIDNIEEINGRWLLINSFKNIGQGVIAVFNAMKDAWQAVFPPKSIEERAKGLFNLIAAFHKFTAQMRVNDDVAKKFKRTFKGVFAAIDIVMTLVGGPLKIAFKAFTQLLGMFDLNILDVTATIGDAIVKFRDWIDASLDFTGVFKKIIPPITKAVDAFKAWIASLKDSKDLPKDIADGIVKGLGKAVTFVRDLFKNVVKQIQNGFDGTGGDVVSGFVKGIWEGIQVAGQVIAELAKRILAKFREILGIQSPSKETESDGKNFVQGFIDGLTGWASGAWSAIRKFAGKCLEVFREIDWGALFAAGIGVGMLFVVNKAVDVIDKLTAPFEGIKNVLDEVADMFKAVTGNIKARTFKHISTSVLNMALAIGILAASLFLITKIPTENLWESVGALAALAGIVAVLSGVAIALEKLGGNGAALLSIVSIAAALLILSHAMKQLMGINVENAGPVIAAFIGMIVGLGAILWAFGKFCNVEASADMMKAGAMLVLMSAAMMIMVEVIKQISGLRDDDIVRGLVVIAALETMFLTMALVSRLAGETAAKVGFGMGLMAGALLLVLGVVKIASAMSMSDVLRGVATLAAVELLFIGLAAVTRLAGENAAKAGGGMILMSGALFIVVQVVKQAAKLENGEIERGLAVVGALEILFMGLIAVSKLAGENAAKAGTMLLLMSGALLILTGVMFLISQMEPSGLYRALGVVAALEVLFMGLIAVTHLAQDCKGTLIVLTVVVALLTAALIGLSFVDPQKLGVAAASLSAIIGVFALLVAATHFLKTGEKTWKRNLVTLGVLTLIVAALGGVLTAMSLLANPEGMITTATALGILLGALTAALVIVSNSKTMSKEKLSRSLITLGVLSGVVVVLGGVLTGMSFLPNPNNLIPTAIALGILLNALAASMVILSYAKGVTAGAAGVAAIMALVVGELALVLGLMAHFNVVPSLETAASLSVLLLALSAACVILSAVGPVATMALAGAGALAGVIAIIGGVAIAIGALMSLIPPELVDEWKTGLSNFMDFIVILAAGLGEAVGAFLGGAVGGLAVSLPIIGESMSAFMTSIKGFVDGCKEIDDSVINGALAIAGAIVALSVADFVAGLTTLNGLSLVAMGQSLSDFMTSLQPFIEGTKNLDPASMAALSSLAEAILVLTAADLINGLTSWFTGEASLAAFGEDLAAFGPAMKTYADAVAGIDPTTVTASANAAKILAEMASNLPNSGGWLGAIFGENDADMFGAQLASFGRALKLYGISVTGLNIDAINASIPAGEALTKLAESVPDSGGWLAAIAGDNTLDEFGRQLATFGRSLTLYGVSVANLNTSAIEESVPAAKALSDLAEAVPNSGGWLAAIAGDNDMATFGTQLASFGNSLMSYGRSVATISMFKTAVETSVSVAKKVSEVAGIAKTVSKGDLGKAEFVKFGENLVSFGGSMAAYSMQVSDIDTTALSSSTEEFGKLADMVSGMADVDFDGMGSFGESLAKIGSDAVTKFIHAFKNAYSQALTTGKTFILQVKMGALSAKDAVTSGFNTLLNAVLSTIRNRYYSFYFAGSYLVTGFAAGISANTWQAEAKATAMASAAVEAAKEELDEHSPSRVGYGIGDFFGIAFVNGIADNVKKAYDASTDVAASAKAGLTNAVNKIRNYLDSDMDVQPTIRPVLDLSDVRAGAGSIGGLFNLGTSVGVSANVRALNARMNARSQNGTNSDIVNAIDKLGKKMNNVGNTNYTINGVTYDDGSNVADAVRVIARAIKVERRV